MRAVVQLGTWWTFSRGNRTNSPGKLLGQFPIWQSLTRTELPRTSSPRTLHSSAVSLHIALSDRLVAQTLFNFKITLEWILKCYTHTHTHHSRLLSCVHVTFPTNWAFTLSEAHGYSVGMSGGWLVLGGVLFGRYFGWRFLGWGLSGVFCL